MSTIPENTIPENSIPENTIQEILRLSAQFLGQRRAAEEVISSALNCSRLNLYMLFDQPLTPAELTRCREFLRRYRKGEPLAYIRGEVEFYDCVIQVNPHVLIPRQETEILVDLIIKSAVAKKAKVWDLCCGSGAIGIALKKKRDDLEVVLGDFSREALDVARSNAERNEVDVECIWGDFLSPFKGRKADVIVCNPPYVTENEWAGLEKGVKDFEPKMALVGGADGLDFYRRLAEEGRGYLEEAGVLWLEIGKDQGKAVQALFQGWGECRVLQDWAGHDRFVRVSS